MLYVLARPTPLPNLTIPRCPPTLPKTGKYLLVRDPNKPQLRLYAIPAAEELHYAGEAGAGAADAADEE